MPTKILGHSTDTIWVDEANFPAPPHAVFGSDKLSDAVGAHTHSYTVISTPRRDRDYYTTDPMRVVVPAEHLDPAYYNLNSLEQEVVHKLWRLVVNLNGDSLLVRVYDGETADRTEALPRVRLQEFLKAYQQKQPLRIRLLPDITPHDLMSGGHLDEVFTTPVFHLVVVLIDDKGWGDDVTVALVKEGFRPPFALHAAQNDLLI